MTFHVPARADDRVYGPDPTKAYGGLTPKQYRYCLLRADGLGQAQAYKEAYQSEAHATTVAAMAYDMEALPSIVMTINQMVRARTPQTSLVPLVDKDFVLQGITAIAIKETAKDNVRLRAYELLGKTVGLFKDEVPTVSKPRTIEDIDRELRERLQSMRTIEGAVTRVEPGTLEPDSHQPAQSTGDRRRKPKV